MRTVSPEDRYVAWARFNTHDGRSAATLHLCDSDAPGAFRVYRWEDVQDGAAREIKRLTAALERIRTGIAHDRCDGDSEFAAGVSAACRNHLELVNAAVAYGVRACGSNECVAGQRDGVLCANGECDRENGVRPDGVATRHPRCGYPYCACVGECFAASQPGVTAGVEGTKNG